MFRMVHLQIGFFTIIHFNKNGFTKTSFFPDTHYILYLEWK